MTDQLCCHVGFYSQLFVTEPSVANGHVQHHSVVDALNQ